MIAPTLKTLTTAVLAQVDAAAEAAPAAAETLQTTQEMSPGNGLGFWLIILAGMSLLPFMLTMVTSFAKLVVIGGILRQALGLQNIPPNSVITGLALILSMHIMWPVASEGYRNYQQKTAAREAAIEAGEASEERTSAEVLGDILTSIEPPMRRFLETHAHPEHVVLFEDLRDQSAESHAAAAGDDAAEPIAFEDPAVQQAIDDLVTLAPAFVLSELTEAFQIGFILFVPFLVIDLAVSNLLLAMGMHMLSPITFSLPIKLLLFVLIDGWTLIIRGMVMGYV